MDMSRVNFVMLFVFFGFLMNFYGGVTAFKEVIVGGHHAWGVPVNNDTSFYDDWASKRRFHVGDSLVFEYKNDSVLVVDKFGYYHCNISNATASYTDGNTIIKLEHPGVTYFISGTSEHCGHGQRMQVNVMSPHPHPTASPPEDPHHGDASVPAPAPSVQPKSGASHLQVSLFMGVVGVVSLLLV